MPISYPPTPLVPQKYKCYFFIDTEDCPAATGLRRKKGVAVTLEDQLESALSDEKKREITTRLSRALGHLRHVKRMVEDGRDCSEVLIQLAAVNGALSSAGKEIIGGYLEECLQDILEHGDTGQLEEFKETLNRFSG